MDKAREDLDAAILRSSIPPTYQTLASNEQIIITRELEECIKQAEESRPELEKIYHEKLEAWNNCVKANKERNQ